MSIFGDLDVESAADDPFAVDDGTYEAEVIKASVGLTKDGTKTGLTLVYRLKDDPIKTVSEWKHIPAPADPKNLTDDEAKAASWLKQRILSLGVPANRINQMTPEDLIGIEVVITVKNKDGYTNVSKVVVADEAEESEAWGTDNFSYSD